MGDCEPKDKGITMKNLCLKGKYLLQVLDAQDCVLREVCTDNLIMQSGIDTLLKNPHTHGFNLTNLCEKCWVGNDDSQPKLTDAGLGNVLYSKATADWDSLVLNNLAASYTIVGTRVFQFAHQPREYLIWEVGTSPVVGSPWFSRAVVPAAIIIKPTEKLKVVFELTLEVSTVKVVELMPFDGSDLIFSMKYVAPQVNALANLFKSSMLITGNPDVLTLEIYYPGEYWDSGIPGIGTRKLPPWVTQAVQVSYDPALHKYAFSTPLGLPPVPIASIVCYRQQSMLPMAVEFPVPPRIHEDQYFSFTAVRHLVNR